MATVEKKKTDLFSILLPTVLIGAVILSVISYVLEIKFEPETYAALKGYFFVPLKSWTFVVIAAAMFGVFFRSPEGGANKFAVLFVDIMILYFISTTIANIYAFGAFQLLPFAETIAPLLGNSEETYFDAVAPEGLPLVIWVMIIGISSSIVCRYLLSAPLAVITKNICKILVIIFNNKIFDRISYIKDLKSEHSKALQNKNNIDQSLALINFLDKIIFGILMLILLIAPLAVYASFLDILSSRGFHFFIDLGKFIGFYALILLSYKFFITTLIRKIFCLGIKGETYKSFLVKALPVIATAGTTASSVATLAHNIRAAQSLIVPEDMQNKGHNRALMPIGATFNMDGTSISLVIYFLLAANLAGMEVDFLWVVLTAVGLSVGTAAVPSASLIMLTSMYSAFAIPAAITSKLLSIIIAVDPINDRIRTIVNAWGDLNMVYIVQCKRGILTMICKGFKKKFNKDEVK
ncbi:MAG: L-cystine uptake protein TcyP (sodium:dicarboxylate symporter family) [Rickettsiales bacterium]|jgi:L-cystine uptake protein TcyP (sodium:dicarboxylate symporter family)